VFVFDHAMSFNAPLIRVKVEVGAVAPFASAMIVTAFESVAGAAWTVLVEIASAMAAEAMVIPRLTKNLRNFSTARLARVWAVLSTMASSAQTCFQSLPSKYGS